MIALHGLWSRDGILRIWGERPLEGPSLPRPRGRRPAAGRSRRHPYAADGGEVRSALAAVGGGSGTATEAAEAEVALLLPSTADAPLPSPALPGASAVAAAASSLTPWRVPCLVLGPGPALDVLVAIPTADPRTDATLSWLGTAARLALDLTARGRVLPGVAGAAHGRVEARWLPVLSVEDRARLARLGAGMPPALRAQHAPEPPGRGASPGGAPKGGTPATEHPADDASALLRNVVSTLVDAAVRTSLRARGTVVLPSVRQPSSSRAVEPWLAALAEDDASFSAPAGDLTLLVKQLTAWRDSAAVDTGPLRTCFRLAPPSGDDDTGAAGGIADAPAAATSAARGSATSRSWRLEFCLQATDDPSLIVDAGEVWRADRTLAFLERTFEQPEERLLGDLGRASRLYPELERALHVALPTALELSADEALGFLAEGRALLEQSGFGVLVPAELRRPARLGARLRAKAASESGRVDADSELGIDGLAEYRWELAVGDETLTEAELRELARLKSPLVRVRGTWVALRPEEVARAVSLLERQRDEGPRTAAVGAVIALGLGLSDPGIGLPVVGADGEGTLGALLRGDAAERMAPMATPERFAGTLRPYQERGLAWLAFLGRTGLGACLADDMGLGKTAQLLALLAAERTGVSRRSKRWPSPTLLVCPTSVIGNWEREAERFTPDLRVLVHHGTIRLRGAAFAEAARSHDLVLTTYPLCVRDGDTLVDLAWGRVALDEAQHIKNSAARQTKAIRALPAAQRVALTGTPVENRLSELWSILEFLNPGLLGSAKAFRETYAVPIERYADEEAAARLKRVTQPFVLRRLKTDRTIIDDLPEKLETKEHCALTREQASLYQATVDDMLAQIEEADAQRSSSEAIAHKERRSSSEAVAHKERRSRSEAVARQTDMARKGLVLATMLRLKQVCDHPALALGDGSRLADRSGKLTRLEELVDEILDAGEKALIFTQFAEMGALLATHLRERLGRDVAFLHGGTTKRGRDAMVAAFEAPAGPPLFVLSLKAGGVGLNLTAANHVVHYDRWWNPAVENQATDRAFRIGQRRNVLVRKMMATGTLEEKIDAMIERKQALAEQVVGTGESWLTELSTEELRSVLSLSPVAAGRA